MKIKIGQKIIDKIRGKKKINLFTSNSTLFYTVKILKDYGISNIVASPGTQNANFNFIVQRDNFFKCYSVVDERSAAYVATGIANQKQKPVVITCTEATASRNYMSALTEAFYRNIPIIALTFYNDSGTSFNLCPQYIDRSVNPNDIKTISVNLPAVVDWDSRQRCLLLLNAAISTAVYKKEPVHINCPSFFAIEESLNIDELSTWKTKFYFDNFGDLSNELSSKRIAIYIGSHNKFDEQTLNSIETFARNWKAPVFYDHTSSYNGRCNGILSSKATRQVILKNYPEIIIDIGGVSGDYFANILFQKANVWRVVPSGKFSCRFSMPVQKHIVCSERLFFSCNLSPKNVCSDYYQEVAEQINKIKITKNLPLSNMLVCKYLAKYIPKNSILNVSILNSLRCMNFFELDKSIESVCNVGGFGIDGQVSTFIGHAISNKDKLNFGLFGDLAFFYDMNILGNRHIGNNIRIILINNNKGEEFRLNPALDKTLGDLTDIIISAGGHYKSGARAWAQACGFEYIVADAIEGLEDKIKSFCQNVYDKPVLFEIKTTDIEEKESIRIMTEDLKND